MKEVPKAEFFKLKNLLDIIAKEMNGPITAAEAVVNLDRAATGKYLKIFSDNVDDPKHCLVLAHYPGLVHSGFLCAVIMMYSLPQHRNQASLDEMHAITEKYALEHSCDRILGSAWKYKGARGIDSMWLSKGYEIQENVYVKNL